MADPRVENEGIPEGSDPFSVSGSHCFVYDDVGIAHATQSPYGANTYLASETGRLKWPTTLGT
jgi:hypothetical protein